MRVGEPDRLVDVVGDEDDRLAGRLVDARHLALQGLAGDGVERAEGLVHEQDAGSAASARATPTRCCWPPESWRG